MTEVALDHSNIPTFEHSNIPTLDFEWQSASANLSFPRGSVLAPQAERSQTTEYAETGSAGHGKRLGKNTLRTSIGPSSQYNVGGLSVPGPKGDFSNCLPCPAKRVSAYSVVKNSDTPKPNNIISQKHSKLDQLDKGCQSSFPFHPYSHYAPKLYGPRKLGAYLGSYEYI